jgi:hypothetical protein
MKRSLLICAAIMMLLQGTAQNVNADTLQVTLDLRNTSRTNALSGGTWQLFARRVDGAGGVVGDNGLAGLRAIINNISATGITFNAANNGAGNVGAANAQVLTGTTVEVVWGQNLAAPNVITGLGVSATVNLDRLIASGTWPAGPRPTFGTDGALSTEGNFLNTNVAPFGNSIEASGANVTTSVVTLGDMNNSGTITSLDISGFVARLPGASPSLPYNPAADINQSGTVSGLDISPFVAILSGPSSASVSAVPEPSTLGLALLTSMGLIARRRRV